MGQKNFTEVLINGKIYNLGGMEEEVYLQKVAAYLNEKIRKVKRQKGFSRLEADYQSVMIQLNIADDYFKEQERAGQLVEQREAMERDTYSLKHALVTTQMRQDSLEQEVADIRRRLEENQTELAEANKKLAESREELADVRKKLEESRKEPEELRKALAESQHERETLQGELADVRKKLEESQSAKEALRGELTEALGELARFKADGKTASGGAAPASRTDLEAEQRKALQAMAAASRRPPR